MTKKASATLRVNTIFYVNLCYKFELLGEFAYNPDDALSRCFPDYIRIQYQSGEMP